MGAGMACSIPGCKTISRNFSLVDILKLIELFEDINIQLNIT